MSDTGPVFPWGDGTATVTLVDIPPKEIHALPLTVPLRWDGDALVANGPLAWAAWLVCDESL